jgi:recombinational DNA repair ATPase RecF
LLPVYTEKLAELGGYLFARRASFLAALAREARNIHYESLTEGLETLRLRYLPRLYHSQYTNGGDDVAAQEEWAQWLETADAAAASPASARRWKRREVTILPADGQLSARSATTGRSWSMGGIWVVMGRGASSVRPSWR